MNHRTNEYFDSSSISLGRQGSRCEILAVASGGGHWEELLLLTEIFDKRTAVFVTTQADLLQQIGHASGFVVQDCNRDRPLDVITCLIQCSKIVLKHRPKVVISTGAAPGLICLAIGRLLGSQTIWLDSIANMEKLSMSGRIARYLSNQCLTQWEHLSRKNGPCYHGALL